MPTSKVLLGACPDYSPPPNASVVDLLLHRGIAQTLPFRFGDRVQGLARHDRRWRGRSSDAKRVFRVKDIVSVRVEVRDGVCPRDHLRVVGSGVDGDGADLGAC